jgi:hypothetical protein
MPPKAVNNAADTHRRIHRLEIIFSPFTGTIAPRLRGARAKLRSAASLSHGKAS